MFKVWGLGVEGSGAFPFLCDPSKLSMHMDHCVICSVIFIT